MSNSESRNWVGMRIMRSKQELRIGILTMRQTIGIRISPVTSLYSLAYLVKRHRTMPHGKIQNRNLFGVGRAIEDSEVK